ncbi:unnamed protein product [Polarella glacialis]|uniref:Pseudouridine synthase RsuA/RluA-like domain-containing protein n=1 Tax=Polarella glacialis TaxID=89957 RepID=A0A813HRA0_POLGL|nr:unnamed protein product [Polarella glacialis]
MPERKLTPNEVSYSAAISACEKVGRWQLALKLLDTMPQISIVPNAVSFNAAISACEKGGQWEMALSLLRQMPHVKISPNTITYSAAISACEKGGQWQLAFSLLNLMPEMTISQNAVSYNAAISACEKGGQWQLALSLLSNMLGIGLSLDGTTSGAALSACEQVSAWQPALALLDNMLSSQLLPNGLHAGSAASSLRKALGDSAAYELLDKLRELWEDNSNSNSNNNYNNYNNNSNNNKQPWEDSNNNNKQPEVRLWEAGQPVDQQLAVPPEALAAVFDVLSDVPGVIAIFKPSGVTTEEAVNELSQQLARQRHVSESVDLHIVSRLDHPTSGVLPLALGAVGSTAANWLEAQFAGRLVRKEYVCLCEGPSLGLTGCQGNVSTPLHTVELDGGRASRTEVSPIGRQAFTGYEVLAGYMPPLSSEPLLPSHDGEPGATGHADEQRPEGPELMLLRVRPLTGRTHQIRVHLASIGRPLVGDLTYGAKEASVLSSCPRLFLHARRIELRDLAGKPFVAEAELPHELEEVLAQLQQVAETSPEDGHQS